MLPNKHNWCGGNYSDWMEVMLTEKCNGSCSWCVEQNGFHPEYHASVNELSDAIKSCDAPNIILLGGEPTLYKNLVTLIEKTARNKNIYITTNGSMLTGDYIDKIHEIRGINISIHHYKLNKNKEITDIKLEQETLEEAIARCRYWNIPIRFNCNIINGHIDSEEEILKYIQWAKETGADKIRFAELKIEEDNFVDLAKIMAYKYGLNDNPYIDGCNKDTTIKDMPINFRQMCGLQTSKRIKPINPKSPFKKKVLYYDGIIYDGWQTKKEGNDLTETEIRQIIHEELKEIKIEGDENTYVAKLERKIKELQKNAEKATSSAAANCQY